MAADLIFNEIAQSTKQRLIAWNGRSFILPYEWIYLKNNGFPFDIPKHKMWTALSCCIEIKDLDISPLVRMLECRFSFSKPTVKSVVEEYAWKIVMDSVSYVWGG